MAEKPEDVRPKVVVMAERYVMQLEEAEADKALDALTGLWPKLCDVDEDAYPEIEELKTRVNRQLDAGLESAVKSDLPVAAELPAKVELSAKVKAVVKPRVREWGRAVTVQCDCGWSRRSAKGDWTSIRWQAKTHASKCDKACPYAEYVNDFDAARKSLQAGIGYTTGGLSFWLDSPKVVSGKMSGTFGPMSSGITLTSTTSGTTGDVVYFTLREEP